ncbi:organic cation/carnitine transporter 7-like isoform X2 [Aricia agestis]|uniref:organic cation/carnitine transporter 7-like isoform X2 n=1 Tax=Aricia agestis TaxID=91739 RepID=UPI001C202A21|nr:organic cation/carnitine transporter 7-like isoform X2 [Aricia agestis]
MFRGRKNIGFLHHNFTLRALDSTMAQNKDELPLNQPLEKIKMETDLEKAMDLAGAGKFQFAHCALMVATLSAAILEIIGSSYILPAASCDLDIPDHLRGIITSIPNIGIILTATLWGRAADNLGRKPVLLLSTAIAGIFGMMASLMPNLLGYVICKSLGSLFLSCPSSLGFAYAGEMVPLRRRDFALLLCNGILMFASAACPIIAWAILPHNYDIGSLHIQPWRCLTAANSLPLVFAALWLTRAKESPKFLMTKGKKTQALEILRHIYSTNSGNDKEKYEVISLQSSLEDGDRPNDNCENEKKSGQLSALALLRPPHLKWLALTGFLMFGLFSLLNGLFLFAPSTINTMLKDKSDESMTVCTIMNMPNNETSSKGCNDGISSGTFTITIITSLVYSTLVMLISLSPINKKIQLIGMFTVVATTCLISVLTRNRIVAGISMSALQVTGLGIGPLTAYAVQLFPTNLRGTAVGAVMMFGRVGSVSGANAAGIFLAGACTATFYGFAAILIVCAALSFVLPSDNKVSSER